MISLIVAHDLNYCIGRKGLIPWRLPSDLKRFKELTLGHTVIMGRKTFESLGKPLPRRANIVVSSREIKTKGTFVVVASAQEALAHTRTAERIFIIGGTQIYNAFASQASTAYISKVEVQVPGGDAYFPQLPSENWKRISTSRITEAGDEYPYDFEFWINSKPEVVK